MSTATLTPTTAAEQLLADVRQMLEQHSGADDIDELRSIADELAAVLRKVRGRIKRITKRDTPTRTPDDERQVSAHAGDEAGTQPVEPPAPGPATPRCAPVAVGMNNPTVEFPPVRGRIPLEELPRPDHGKHRPDVAPRPLVAVLTCNDSQWPLGEHHRGEHHQTPSRGAWLWLILGAIVIPLLCAVLAVTLYEPPDDAATPSHSAPAPATTGQTPTPPVAGRGAR